MSCQISIYYEVSSARFLDLFLWIYDRHYFSLFQFLVENGSKWRHVLKNTARIEIIITISVENCTNTGAKAFVLLRSNCCTNYNFKPAGTFENLTSFTPIAHLHDDVTRAKSSGSCSQIRGMLWIAMVLKDNNSVDKTENLGSCRVILTEEDIPGGLSTEKEARHSEEWRTKTLVKMQIRRFSWRKPCATPRTASAITASQKLDSFFCLTKSSIFLTV